ncbi:MAG: hypothetical protein WBA89_20630 [Microcoleus sp.]|uniref:hypothetical protein n=1 Tax=Microcoleus sp. TaxID=44472 RepID=UPI003C72C958
MAKARSSAKEQCTEVNGFKEFNGGHTNSQKFSNSFGRGGFTQIDAKSQNIKQPALNTVAQMQEHWYHLREEGRRQEIKFLQAIILLFFRSPFNIHIP